MQNRYSGRETRRRNSRFITFHRTIYLLFLPIAALSSYHFTTLLPYLTSSISHSFPDANPLLSLAGMLLLQMSLSRIAR